MSEKEAKEFRKKMLEGAKEVLRQSLGFTCACCQLQKLSGEKGGAFLYEPKDERLRRAMIDEKSGMPRVCTYVLCHECLDSVPDEVIYQKVTAYVGTQGLFGTT